MSAAEALFALIAFAVGALPFSLWIGLLALGVDIRDYGDGNPGTFNVFRAGGGLHWGGLALMLDISKGAAPVGLAAQVWHIDGLALVIIAVSPVFGHAFSPLLGFRGGKAIATTAGMLIGLSLVELPIVGLPMLLLWYFTLTSSGWAVMLTAVGIVAYTLLAARPHEWVGALLLLLLLLAYKHRSELRHLPRFKHRSQSGGTPHRDNSRHPVHNGGVDRH